MRMGEWRDGAALGPAASPLGKEPRFPPSRSLDVPMVQPRCLIKFTPEQTTKDQRGSRGIALLFL
jgi:hypothetical protein